jgi:hypothetical protein
LNEIKLYTEEKGKNFKELNDEGWVADPAFLVVVSGHLNNLNKQLQRKGELITDMYDSIMAFEVKLRLVKTDYNCVTLFTFHT